MLRITIVLFNHLHSYDKREVIEVHGVDNVEDDKQTADADYLKINGRLNPLVPNSTFDETFSKAPVW
jgi:hypothetical protein